MILIVFWLVPEVFTGFSIEGKSLNKLALTKLPFPVPDDPYIELLSKGMSKNDKYKKIVSPSMLVKLEQGLGRLIRSKMIPVLL